MKYLLSLLLVSCLTFSMYGQNCKGPADFKLVVGVAQDVKMAYEGPHGDGGEFNLEGTFGFEWSNLNVWTGVEVLSSIEYLKWTYLAVDINLFKLADNTILLAVGPEISGIKRGSTNRDYQDGANYQISKHFYSYGGNATITYYALPNIGVYANTNIFKAEPYDNFGNTIDKDFRWDVRVGVKIVLFST